MGGSRLETISGPRLSLTPLLSECHEVSSFCHMLLSPWFSVLPWAQINEAKDYGLCLLNP